MINYEQYQHLHLLCKKGLSTAQIAREIGLNVKTVTYWLKIETFHSRKRKVQNGILAVFPA